SCQQFHQWRMKQPDRRLQHAQQLRCPQSPTIAQQRVVLFLDADAGQLAEHIKTVRKLLKLDQFYLPPSILLGNDRLQRYRRVPMTTAGVVEKNLNFLHRASIVPHQCERSAKKRGHAPCHVENSKSPLCSISSTITFITNSRPFYALFISCI